MRSVVFALMLVAMPAHADETQARQLYRQATEAYTAREYSAALDLFHAAYSASHRPALLFDIAQCQRQLGRYDDAIASFRSFLNEAQPGDAVRERVEHIIADLPKPAVEPVAQPIVAQPAPPPVRVDLIVPAPARTHRRKWIPWVAGAAGVVAVGVAIGVGVGVSRYNETPSATTNLGTVRVNP
jgi:hypothetical protein